MAIAFDTAVDGGNNGGAGGTQSWAHTCTGNNLILFVVIWGDLSAGADDISSVTYNGIGMTLIGKINVTLGRWNYLYYLAGPSPGSNVVAITAGSTHYLGGESASYTGASQTGIPDSSATNSQTGSSSGSTLSTNLTTVANNCWVLTAGYANSVLSAASGTRVVASAFGNSGIFDTGAPITPAGLVVLAISGDDSLSAIVASFAPAIVVTYDANSNSGYQTAVSGLTWNHTCTGTNGFIGVDIEFLSVNNTVSSVTYNGVALNFIGAQNVVGGTGRVESWGLAGPATGTNAVSVTFASTLVTGAASGTAVSYYNVNQSSPTEAFNGNSGINAGTGTNATVVVTTLTANDWVHAALATSQNSGIASSQTSRNIVAGTLGTGANADTNGVVTPAGAQTMTFTGEGITSAWAVAGYGIVPYSAASTGNLFRQNLLNGLGIGGPFFISPIG